MEDRDLAVRADILTLRSLANLDVSIAEGALVIVGVSDVLISLKAQAINLHQLYEGVVQLAARLGDSWDEALMLTRNSAAEGHSDPNVQVAYDKLLRDTAHLYGR